MDDVKGKIDKRNRELDAKDAAREADWAEGEAQDALDFADWAIENAQLAMLDAIEPGPTPTSAGRSRASDLGPAVTPGLRHRQRQPRRSRPVVIDPGPGDCRCERGVVR